MSVSWMIVLSAALSAGIVGFVTWLLATSRRAGLIAKAAGAEAQASSTIDQLRKSEAELADARQETVLHREKRIEAETRLVENQRRLQDQEEFIGQLSAGMKDAFASLSSDALRQNAEQFLENAKKTLGLTLADAQGDLGKRQEAIHSLVKPIEELLKRSETHIQSLEQDRRREYGALGEQLKQLATTSQHLQQETSKLGTALRDPRVRGKWGEIQLRRTVEMAGMTKQCDFEEQQTIDSDDGRLRPDLWVNLPNGRKVVVDAKAVLDAFLDAAAATDDASRREHLNRHAAHVKARVKELSDKNYAERLRGAIEFVVLFLPGESFFSAAIESDSTLIEHAWEKRVVLASPTTLIALLRMVFYGWRQNELAENAEKISAEGREMFERLRTFFEYVNRLGSSLGQSVRVYNEAVGSLKSRVCPSVRRLGELGTSSGKEMPELRLVDTVPRELSGSLEIETRETSSEDLSVPSVANLFGEPDRGDRAARAV